MATMIFVNLPVKDLATSREFFAALGYAFDEKFSDDNAACLVISDTIYAMLLVEPFFQTFTKKQIADSATSTEVLLGLSAESKEHVDELVDRALAAGATPANDTNDQGFMYGRSFEDLDGHTWEVMWMDPKAIAG